jgi:mannose-1-phosphate guanylyltransferase
MARPKALILAAGLGERLRPLTLEIPKLLLPVAGRPVAAHALDALARAGCAAVAVNLHHLGERVRAALGDAWRGVPLHYSDESRLLLGTGGALPPLGAFFAGARTLVVVNGDSLCRWPLDRLLAAHRRGRAPVTLLVSRRADPRRFGGGVAIERGRVVAFRRGALAWEAASVKRVFAGAAALDAELLARLPPGRSDIVSALYEPLLAEGSRIAAVESARAWHDLGTPRRYLEGALEFALAGLPPRASWFAAGVEVGAGARVTGCALEAGTRLGEGARLRRSLVLGGARVGAEARVIDSVVGPGVEVAPGAEVVATMLTRAPDGGAPVSTPLGSC